ncbi:pyrroline-5-carboxylate reductase [Vibrio sp.]|nr:pyrroline-5-carboxylate reductase [Vibrio sp.]
MEHKKLAFIGAGNMSQAIISGLINSGYPKELIKATAKSSNTCAKVQGDLGITTLQNNIAATQDAEVIVLAVKPQLMEEVLKPLQNLDWSNKLVISIAAGIQAHRFDDMLQHKLNLIRVMPNTPSMLSEGMSGLFAPQHINEDDKVFAGDLMKAVGKICWVESESKINDVIAAAGSSPAYFFLFMEAMQKESMAQGFDEDTSRLLIQQAALGAAKMVIDNPDVNLETLRMNVTSKGGATAEAIRTFKEHDLELMVTRAMQAAVKRAEEMEKLF